MDQSILIPIAVFALLVVLIFWRSRHWKTRGEIGELAVAKRLKKLPQEQYKVINDLLLQNNGYSSQIDHVVISPYGIFVIETKNYTGDIYGGANSEMWTQNIYGSKSEFRNPIWQNQGHITAIKKVIGEKYHPMYHNIVLFSENANVRVDRSLEVYNFRKIVPIIEGYTEIVLTQAAVDDIYAKLLAANVTDRKARKEHVKSAKETKKRRDVAVANGICPRCGGKLVLREGRYGKFYGCSNYPRCNYILNK